MPVTYELLSTQVPPIQGAGTLINIDDAAPVVAEGIEQGDHTGVVCRTSRTAARVDVAARYGLGAPAVIEDGLELTDEGGLTLGIGAGQANIDGVTPQDADPDTPRTLALTGGGVGVTIYNYVWVSRGGAFNKTTSSDPNAPAAP